MKYYHSKTIHGEFETVRNHVTDALKSIGFGIISTIDVSAALKDKIGVDYKPYLILGACNPGFAYQALQIEEMLGVILPCNVVLIDQGNGNIEVAAMHPSELIQAMGKPELIAITEAVSESIAGLIDNL
jgi:uncharacterized protein (DUF302 family)